MHVPMYFLHLVLTPPHPNDVMVINHACERTCPKIQLALVIITRTGPIIAIASITITCGAIKHMVICWAL